MKNPKLTYTQAADLGQEGVDIRKRLLKKQWNEAYKAKNKGKLENEKKIRLFDHIFDFKDILEAKSKQCMLLFLVRC